MGLSTSTLSEQDRAKLDGIVSKMQSNGESEDNIRFVVDDFKQKYSQKKNEVTNPALQELEVGISPISPSSSKSTSTENNFNQLPMANFGLDKPKSTVLPIPPTKKEVVNSNDSYAASLDNEIQDVIRKSERKFIPKSYASSTSGQGMAAPYKLPFSDFDPNDDKSYETIINELKTSDKVEGLDGDYDKAKVADLIKKLEQRKLLLISRRGITPIEGKAYPDFNEKQNEDYFKTKIEDATSRFMATSKIVTDPSKSVSADKVTAENFRYGLEELKTSDRGKYNNILASLKEKGKVAEPDFERIAEMGQMIRNQKLFIDKSENTELEGEESNIKYLGNSYESKRAIAAGKMGEWLKRNGGSNQSEFTEEQMKKAAKATGLTDNEILKDLIFTEKLSGVDAIPKSGLLPSLFDRGLFTPINSIVTTLSGVGDSQAETYLKSNSLGDKSIGTNRVLTEKGQAVDKLDSDKDNILYGAVEGLGQFVTQVGLTGGIGGLARAAGGTALKGVLGEGLTGALVGTSEASKAAMLTGTFASTYLQEYGQSYEDALNKTGDVSDAKKMASLDAVVAAGFELWLPDAQIASNALGAFKKAGFANTLLDIVKRGGDPNELLKKGTSAFVKFAGTTGNVMLQEIAEEVGTAITQHGIEMVYSPNTAKKVDLVDEIVETAKATAIQTLLPAIISGGGAALQKDFTQKSLHDAALNIEQYKRGFDDLLANGKMNQEDYNKSISLISTHRNSIQNAPEVDANNERIKREDRLEYATQQTSIKMNKAKLENKELSTPEIKNLNDKIKKAEEIQEAIFNPISSPNTQQNGESNNKETNAEGQGQEGLLGSQTEADQTPASVNSANDLLQKARDTGKLGVFNSMPDEAALDMIAQQAQNLDDKGNANDDGREEMAMSGTVNQFGQELVDAAIERYNSKAKPEQKIKGTPEEISQPIDLSIEPLTAFEKKEWGELSMAEKLKLAKENLPEVQDMSDTEISRIADKRAKELLPKVEAPEIKAVEPSTIKKEVGTIYTDSNGNEKVIVQINKDGSFLVKGNDGKSQNPILGNESDLSKNEPSTVMSEVEIENKKADIEKRRQEELKNIKDYGGIYWPKDDVEYNNKVDDLLMRMYGEKSLSNDSKRIVDDGTYKKLDAELQELHSKRKSVVIDKANAKYDAELAALKSENKPIQSEPTETTTAAVSEPVQRNESVSENQGTENNVQGNTESVGQGDAKPATPIQPKPSRKRPVIAERKPIGAFVNKQQNDTENTGQQLSEQDNDKQESVIKGIESVAENTEGATDAQLAEAEQQAVGLINLTTAVSNVPLSEISTNTDEYQGRKNAFSERSAKNVAKNFDANKFDPIVVYKHPNGKTYVLSGHSRLEGMKRRNAPTIQARYFNGTPEQAAEFAQNSNKFGTVQTDIENAAYYRAKLNAGASYNALMEEAKENEQAGSVKRIVSLAYLNPKGKTMQALSSLESGEGDTKNNIMAIAAKIGDIRAKNDHLTNAHENELFEYMLSDSENIPTDKQINDPANNLNRSISTAKFSPGEPLNLERAVYKSQARIDWEAERDELTSAVADLKKQVNPNQKTGWNLLKEKAIATLARGDKSKSAIDKATTDFENNKNGIKDAYQKQVDTKRLELTAMSDKLAKHLLREKSLIEGDKAQTSLFSAKDTRTAEQILKDELSDKEAAELEKYSNIGEMFLRFMNGVKNIPAAVAKIFNRVLNAIKDTAKFTALATIAITSLNSANANNAPTSFEKKLGDKLTKDSLVKEYGERMAGRWSDYKMLDKKTASGKTFRQVFQSIADEYGLPVEILFASTAEEGLRDFVANPFDTKDKTYPVSGFENFGLDNFTSMFPNLVKEGYLENDFPFKPSNERNEKNEVVKSANFKTVEDAIRAKAAILTYVDSKVVEFADKNNIELSQDAQDFFMLIGYNAGFGNATKMLSDYSKAGVLKNDSFLYEFPSKGNAQVRLTPNSWSQPYEYAMRRVIPADAWREKGVFGNANTALFSIVGEKANLDQEVRNNLSVARQMEAAGKTSEEIYISTGWEKSKDQKWRYEIPDVILNMEKVGESGDLELKDMIKSDSELVKAHPELANAIVVFVPNMDGMGAYQFKEFYFNEDTGKAEAKHIIELNTSLLDNVPQLKKVLIHEIQHGVQQIEGFAKGGSPNQWAGTIQDLLNKNETDWRDGKITYEEKYKRDVEVKKANNPKDAFNRYTKIAGEVEARNVETRSEMTNQQRKELPLSYTEDVARKDQALYFGNGVQERATEFPNKNEVSDFVSENKNPVTLEKLKAKYPTATVVKTQSELPVAILKQARAQGVKTIEGVLHKGVVYMVADNLENMGRAEGVFRHETIGHAGVIAELKGKLNNFAASLVENATGLQQKQIERLSQRLMGRGANDLNAAEKSLLGQEYIAQAAEKSDSYPTTWDKVVSFVRSVLRDLGIKMSVSDRDIKVLLGRSAKQTLIDKKPTRSLEVKGSSNVNSEVKAKFDALFSINDKEVEYNKERKERYNDWKGMSLVGGDEMIKVYRTIAKDRPINPIKAGDWVTANKSYLELYGDPSDNIVEAEIPAKYLADAQTGYNALDTLIYVPEKFDEESKALFSSKDDWQSRMQEMLNKVREQQAAPQEEVGSITDYADEMIDWVKGQNQNATANDVISELEKEKGNEFTEEEAEGLYDYVRKQFGEDVVEDDKPGRKKLSDVDTKLINDLLNERIDARQYPTFFDMNAPLQQVAAKTQSDGQDRVALDGTYVQAHLEDMRSISLLNSRILQQGLGKNWKAKLIQHLEDNPNAGNVAQVAGLLNVVSTQVFQEISRSRSGAKISELRDLQARVDRMAYDNARSASLALNQRRLYQDFAIGKPVSDILSEVILTPDQQNMKQGVEEALKKQYSDEELNQPAQKKSKTTTAQAAPKTKSESVKEDLVAKGKAAAQQKDEDGKVKNITLAEKLQQAIDALKDFKC